ncbi:MAG: RNA polymerase sigma factor [Novosphingobium sp.]|nr:RNA polymerase sigma factor [Novosphingobium sp.]
MNDPHAPADDRTLVMRALGGHQPSYSELMARHREAVYRVARHHVGEESEALDIAQETFISAFASLNRFDPDRPFRAWLLRIALNKCRDWARRRAVRRLFRMARPLDDALHIADDGQDPESAAISTREVARISAAVAALPANLKDALILCRLEGMSMADAAQVLGLTEKAVETRIYRARQKLSEILEG